LARLDLDPRRVERKHPGQMEPTEAFKRMYEGFMKPGTDTASRLVAIILGESPDSEHVRLRTLSLIGSVLMFRMGHATATRYLGWKRVGPREIAAIRQLAAELVATLSTGRPSDP
jgi:hypothetical protein